MTYALRYNCPFTLLIHPWIKGTKGLVYVGRVRTIDIYDYRLDLSSDAGIDAALVRHGQRRGRARRNRLDSASDLRLIHPVDEIDADRIASFIVRGLRVVPVPANGSSTTPRAGAPWPQSVQPTVRLFAKVNSRKYPPRTAFASAASR